MKQPCVYIMASKRNGTLYVGVTSDLLKRAHEHREGLVPGFSSKYGCKNPGLVRTTRDDGRRDHARETDQGWQPQEEASLDRGAESRLGRPLRDVDLTLDFVIARSASDEAIQAFVHGKELDCFASLAMTMG